MSTNNSEQTTFQSIFFNATSAVPIKVPDYQRAFSWEEKQIKLFIEDLEKFEKIQSAQYYYGHFIAEVGASGIYEIIDGQQRITTFALFLLACKMQRPDASSVAFSLLGNFNAVSYDQPTFEKLLQANDVAGLGEKSTDAEIIQKFLLDVKSFTGSQRRMVKALCQFTEAFKKELSPEKIEAYIAVIMSSLCSSHLCKDKSLAVQVFEMQNTRGVSLTTLEIIKAKLMKFVYENATENRDSKIAEIQDQFGFIYKMEDAVAQGSFRGEMSLEHLFRLHLRVVDDGKPENDFNSPARDARRDGLGEYVEKMLSAKGVDYATNLTQEFAKSVRIASVTLPAADKNCSLVGDVLILEQDLSLEFFLRTSRLLETAPSAADGIAPPETLAAWEKLLFTRDFHDMHYRAWYKEDFPKLFSGFTKENIHSEIWRYLTNGFRLDYTKTPLQMGVQKYLRKNKETILTSAFHWWMGNKLFYAIYKYENSLGTNTRHVLKKGKSVDHILPQAWKEEWANGAKTLAAIKDELKINGIGNLQLLTRSENSGKNDEHPGGKWENSDNWSDLISSRGEAIYAHMMENLLEHSLIETAT